MGVRSIKKQLAGVEDLLLGKGVETQERASGLVNITKFDTPAVVNTLTELLAVDVTKYHTALWTDADRGGVFIYDDTQSLVNDGGIVFNGWVRQYDGAVDISWFSTPQECFDTSPQSVYSSSELNLTSTLTIGSDISINGLKINSTASPVIQSTGTEGTYTLLTGDVVSGAFSCDVASTSGFSVDGWAFIKSDDMWSPAVGDNVKNGEFVRIGSIAGNTITFYGSIVGDYTTANSAKIAPVSLNSGIRINDVTINGDTATDNQSGLYFTLCGDVVVSNSKTNDCDYAHIVFNRCVNYKVLGGEASRTGTQEGVDYGVAHSDGCYNGVVDGFTANSIRHISTIGGSEGISRFIKVVNCFGYNLTDAGIDSHSASAEHSFINNMLHFSNSSDTTMDGIITSGAFPIIEGNTIVGNRRHGVIWQPEVALGSTLKLSGIIKNNTIKVNKLSGTTAGINIYTHVLSGYIGVNAVNISGNIISGADYVIGATAGLGGTIDNMTITGNSGDGAVRGIYLIGVASQISDVIISSNNLSGITGECIYLAGDADTTMPNVIIQGNKIQGGTYSIRTINVQNAVIKDNLLYGYSTARYSLDSLTNALVDNANGEFYSLTGSSTYTLNAKDTNVIVNRAATVTLTLPSPSLFIGKVLNIKTIQAFEVNSASANVCPVNSTTAGTSILPSVAGSWATLKSDGTNWITVAKG